MTGLMKLARAEIRNFRNHEHTILECADGINAILGNNGEGKTNIVEAVSYLCLTKSFYASGDAVVLQIGKQSFEIHGQFVSDSQVQKSVSASYETSTARKSVAINTSPVETFSSIIGQFPVVVLSPEQSGITFGAPSERRKFLDLVVSQSSKLYLDRLLNFRRILRQRNRVLLQGKLTRKDCSKALEPWNESFAQAGSELMVRRETFVREFQRYMVEAYEQLAGSHEKPSLKYEPSVSGLELEEPDSVRETLHQELNRHFDEECRTGTTVAGPHRDELDFRVNGLALRKFASQGQHKTFLVALKLAEFFYLKECCRETPILLLDDVFSELDGQRSQRLLSLVEPLGQVFITTTDERMFAGNSWSGKNRKIFIREGEIVNAEKVGLER